MRRSEKVQSGKLNDAAKGQGRLRDQLKHILTGKSLKARAVRGTMLTVVGFGGQNVIRLGSNLILTRLLFPEAFGIMVLVQVVQAGLVMFSDIGLRASVIQDERGTDPDFLNTVWVLQIGRGVGLWLATVALAAPVATFYDVPLLAQLLPIAAIGAIFRGFNSTRILTASRELNLERLTFLMLGAQLLSVVAMVGLAIWFQSVWALVVGGLVRSLVVAVLSHLVLPGIPNRFGFELAAARQLIGFGKWIFLATVAGYFLNQADRAVLGKFVPLDELAIYGIGLLLATVPRQITQAVSTRVIFPLYARKPPAKNPDARKKINKARRYLTAAAFLGVVALALIGSELVVFLYDARYEAAGPIVILIALSSAPGLVTLTYHRLPIAVGESMRFASIIIGLASLQLATLVYGVQAFGLAGVAIAPAIATLLFYPILIGLIRKYKGWDPVHDAGFFVAWVGLVGVSYWLHGDKLLPLFAAL